MNLELELSKLIEKQLSNPAEKVFGSVGDVVRTSDQEIIVTFGGKQLSVTVKEEWMP